MALVDVGGAALVDVGGLPVVGVDEVRGAVGFPPPRLGVVDAKGGCGQRETGGGDVAGVDEGGVTLVVVVGGVAWRRRHGLGGATLVVVGDVAQCQRPGLRACRW